ncbi:MAG TPA: hypothetical protein DD399_07550, partial [Alcanivorax sp.]|nr:hypothetical protein [Alcanivorax sp.]
MPRAPLRQPGGGAVSELNRIRQQAAEWVVALQTAGADERPHLQAECDTWQAKDPRRRQVLEQIQ